MLGLFGSFVYVAVEDEVAAHEQALQVRHGEMRELKPVFQVCRPTVREKLEEIPSVIALDLRQVVGVLHGVVIRHRERGQAESGGIVGEPVDAEIRKHVRAERVGRKVEYAQPGEGEARFIHPGCPGESVAESDLLRAQIFRSGQRREKSRPVASARR